jgi:hypothetical protein
MVPAFDSRTKQDTASVDPNRGVLGNLQMFAAFKENLPWRFVTEIIARFWTESKTYLTFLHEFMDLFR